MTTDDLRHSENDLPDEPPRPVLHTQADLEALWRQLMGPLGFRHGSIWMLLIDPDGRPIPQVTEFTDAEDVPAEEMVASVAELLRHLHDPELIGRFAFLRSRPGGGGVTTEDLAWGRALHEACRQAGVVSEVVHRANDHDLVAVPMDALLGDDAA